jgi:hypothetical protein
VLGLLAGVSVGLACAGIAGARRTERALPNYARVSRVPDAAVLANDPGYDAAKRAEVARLPEVKAAYPFVVPFALETAKPKGLDPGLVPATPAAMREMAGVIVEGRLPDPHRADEITVNQNVRNKYGLDIGSTITLVQPMPSAALGIPAAFIPPHPAPIHQVLRVVGISHSPDNELDTMPSSGLYTENRATLVGPVNEFVDLRHGAADLAKFQADVQRIAGHPVNVAGGAELFGVKKVQAISNVEQGGLLLFALAVLLGAGALVGQALVRAVTAGAAELPVWRAMGADSRVAVRGLVIPTFVTAAVGAVTAIVVAIALSPRFPIALTRKFDLDVGFHADWAVLVSGALGLMVAVLGAAWATAEIRVRRREQLRTRTSATARVATAAGLPPSLLIGSRLAVEPGQGRRAVPVRSALIGAIVGVLGVVGCLTFRAGLADTAHDPARSGVVWDAFVAADGGVARSDQAKLVHDHAVAAVLDATWARTIRIDGHSTPTFGTQLLKGRLQPLVLEGHAPRGNDEIAFAPTTMKNLGVQIGDVVRVGSGRGRPMHVVGRALLPATSHTDYDESAWITRPALEKAIPRDAGPDLVEDWNLVRFRPGADTHAALRRFEAISRPNGYYSGPATLPSAVISLGKLRALPLALAVFFALLAIATVAHALVTTVRRRRHDLAVLRSIGFTRRDARIAIAWQATLIAIVGLVVGIPLGIVAGRLIWKQLAENFPVAYVPPFALFGVLLVVPVAIIVANLIAAGPGHAATRIRPARVLRTE